MTGSIRAESPFRPRGRSKWAILLAAVMLSILTYFATQLVDRFGIEEEQLLQDHTFEKGGEHWQQKGSQVVDFQSNELTINNKLGKSHSVFQNVEVNTPAFYRFRYMVGVSDVVPTSPEDWALASISIIYRNDGGERIGSKMITSLSGTQPSSQFKEDMFLTESVASIDFAARLYRAGGNFIVSEPVMSRLKELNSYKTLRICIIAAWAILSAYIIFTVIKFFRVWQLLMLAALTAIALAGTMMPEATMTMLTQKLAVLLPESFLVQLKMLLSKLYGPSSFSDAGKEVSKLGHFLIFKCFGLFAGLLWRRCGIYYAIAALFVFSVVTEALQTLVYGRTAHISDLILDNAGGLLGLAIGIGLAELIGLFRQVRTAPIFEEQPDSYEEDHYDENHRYRNR